MTRNPSRGPRRYLAAAASGCAAMLLASACSSGGGSDVDGDIDIEGVDDGATLTMWTRAATEPQSQALVDEYNATHENQVELTVVPTDDYLPRVSTAAGNQDLPDLLALDVVFAPQFTQVGAYRDLTEQIDSLEFADALAPSHVDVGTNEGDKYLVPHTLDISVMFYNKDLYEQAGLDPEQPPTTFREFAEHASAISELGDDVYGTYFTGNCPGFSLFTWWPVLWAEGVEVMNDDGTEAYLDSPEMTEIFDIYSGLVDEGAVYPGHHEEDCTTLTEPFPTGQIGIMPMPSTTLGLMPEDMNLGVAPIPGLSGGQATFGGGDVLGISSNSENADQAWDFIRWTLEEETQLEVLASFGDVMLRTDLADNEYYAENPNVVVMNDIVSESRTPVSLNFAQTFNDPQGPWLTLMREAIYGDGSADLSELNDAITASLSE